MVVWGKQNFGQYGLGHSNRVDVPAYAPVGGVLDAECNTEMCIIRTWNGEIWGAGKLEGFGLPENIYYSWVKLPKQTQITDIVVSEYRKLFVRTAVDKYYGRYNDVTNELGFAPPNIWVTMNTTNVTLRQGDNNTLLIATAQGTSFSKVDFTSENTSVVDVERTYVEGHHDSAIKLYWKGGGTTRIVAQSALGGTPTYINVTAVGNDPPQIKRFYELNNNLNPNPWDSLKLKWEVWEPNGDNMTCRLDLDDSGTWDHTQNNCNDGHEYTHLWNPTQAGARRIKLRVEDGRGGATEAYLGFTVQSTNKPPAISSFTVNPSSGTAPLNVTYSWSVTDPDNDPLTCQLDAHGDGTYEYSYPCLSRSSQAHTFSSNGSYTSRFKVTDGRGGEVSDSRTIVLQQTTQTPTPIVNPIPLLVEFSATPRSMYSAGATPNITTIFRVRVSDFGYENANCKITIYGELSTQSLYSLSGKCKDSELMSIAGFTQIFREYGRYVAKLEVNGMSLSWADLNLWYLQDWISYNSNLEQKFLAATQCWLDAYPGFFVLDEVLVSWLRHALLAYRGKGTEFEIFKSYLEDMAEIVIKKVSPEKWEKVVDAFQNGVKLAEFQVCARDTGIFN